MAVEKPRVITNIYRGRTDGACMVRGTNACESRWPGHNPFATLIEQQRKIARSRGEKEVNVLDIGCGVRGGLFVDYIGQRYNESVVDTDKPNPDLPKIRLIGFTDAPDNESQDKCFKRCSYGELKGAEDVSMELYHHTLTVRQDIDELLRTASVDKLHLVTATQSMIYLGPATFKKTMTQILQKMPPGAFMVVDEYAGSEAVECNYDQTKPVWQLPHHAATDHRQIFSSPDFFAQDLALLVGLASHLHNKKESAKIESLLRDLFSRMRKNTKNPDWVYSSDARIIWRQLEEFMKEQHHEKIYHCKRSAIFELQEEFQDFEWEIKGKGFHVRKLT